ncbi:hypothetical protein ATANTOWER_010262, partial [Ataeniobius toweri]|nr:hypothetical protein [Ataeniobius toweri]
EVSGERDVWGSLLSLLPPRTGPGRSRRRRVRLQVFPSSHTGRLLQSLCFTSMSFLLLHIIYQITVNSLLAGNSISSDFNCQFLLEL